MSSAGTALITIIFARVAVRQLDSAVAWYEQIFGPATARPISGVVEWHFPIGGRLQVYEVAERAGHGSFTVSVTTIVELVATLDAAGTRSPAPSRTPQMDTVMITDLDGKSIAFVGPGEG